MSKLLVIRGNSGSGKSTLAKNIRDIFPYAFLVEQDYYVQYISEDPIKEKARRNRIFDETIEALQNNELVILEGVFDSRRYYDYFVNLIKHHPKDNFFVYIDVSFEETLARHSGREKRHKFGKEKMSEWYIAHDSLDFPVKIDINEEDSLDEAIIKILDRSGLQAGL